MNAARAAATQLNSVATYRAAQLLSFSLTTKLGVPRQCGRARAKGSGQS